MHGGISRDQAWTLFCAWTASPSLRRHVLAVEVAMRAYARRLGGDEETWAVTGLLHDLDYERFPSLTDGHPRIAMRELAHLGYPDDIIRAIGSHADELQIARETPMEKALYAVDELCGFLLACAYVRGSRG
jgi:putative nucleotidyltransferase with HDIG domain